jgi:hypothetical protein
MQFEKIEMLIQPDGEDGGLLRYRLTARINGERCVAVAHLDCDHFHSRFAQAVRYATEHLIFRIIHAVENREAEREAVIDPLNWLPEAESGPPEQTPPNPFYGSTQ